MAFVFNPIFHRILKRTGKEGIAAGLTFVIALIVILIPIMLILAATSWQLTLSVKRLDFSHFSSDPSILLTQSIDAVNRLLDATPIGFRVTTDWLGSSLLTIVQKTGSIVLGNLQSFIGSFISFFTTAIIFIFVFVSLLKNQKIISSSIRSLNPLGPEISDLYMSRISAMTKAMVKGQFIIAIAQGFVDAALVYFAGVHDAFFIFFMLFSVLSFIPLGGGIIAIPIGIILMLTGNWIGGILIIAGHILIVTNIDNILRPKLVPDEAKLDSALTILSVFAGISLIGFLGIVIGPVIMIVVVTTIRVYLEVNSSPTSK
jgi:predicted PurR-regulated permease PerM